ncbi:MAG: response regulator [Bacteroidota bacterium]|nr:response regulator [Bacteroidota bacterium]
MSEQTISSCLLIDDDIDDHDIFGIALKDAGLSADCIYSSDPVEAIKNLTEKTYNPDCIFIDMNMPRMNGTECLTEIRKIERLHRVPIYMYSTAADPVTVNEAKKLGATAFLVKPPSISELALKLKELFLSVNS